MRNDETRTPKLSIYWNAGRTELGKRGFDNFLVGASWFHGGTWRERQTNIHLGLWTLTYRSQA